MTFDLSGLFGYVGLALGVTAGVGALVANILYSRPRIDAQAREIRDLQDDQRTMQATLHEKDIQLELLGDMVKSVPAFAELTKTVAAMQDALVLALRTNTDALVDEIQAHERRSEEREQKTLRTLDAITNRLERHSDHRATDAGRPKP